MNVLQILQNACQQIGIPAPSNFTATDTNTLQLYALFRDVHTYLRNQRIWPQMKSTHSFQLQANQQFYPLPENFFAALLGTQYDATSKFPLIGPLSDAQFDMRQYGLAGFTPYPAFRIFGPDANPYSAGGQFQVWPMPTAAGDTLSFEYQWKNIFLPQNWQPSTAYVANTSYVNANGNIYKCTTSGTSSATTAPTGQSLTPVANGTAAFVYIPQAYETILASTDLSAFDPELVICGFKAWYFNAKTQPQADKERAQFNAMIDAAKRRFVGSFRGSMSRRYSVVNGISPQGNWIL
jgi:hypothetical protein